MHMQILRGLAAGNFHKPDGLRALHLGRMGDSLFEAISRDVSLIMETMAPSVVKEGTHTTGWTKPKGQVRQWSLFNTHGRTNDTSDDFNYNNIPLKKPVEAEGIKQLVSGLPSLVNLRLNVISPGAALSPHEEHTTRRLGNDRVGMRARFHLPMKTSPDCLMMAGGDLFHFQAGHLYFFNNGDVHSATNDGDDDRIHLVWDQLMTRSAMKAMFRDKDLAQMRDDTARNHLVDRVMISDWVKSKGMPETDFKRRKLVFHPDV